MRDTENAAEDSATNEGSAPATDSAGPTSGSAINLRDLTTEALRELHVAVIHRNTHSHNREYLIWRIRAAEKGRIRIGPAHGRRCANGATHKIIPFRIERNAVPQLDEAWQRLGLRSRTDLIRKSLYCFLSAQGEDDVARLFTDEE